LETYQLFKFDTCPFCHRVMRFLQQANIAVETRDIMRDGDARAELLAGGGSQQVPCLRIERVADSGTQVQWLYESNDIIRYLQQHAG